KNGSREYLFLSGNSSFVSIYIDGRDCCQTGQFSQDVADGALTVVLALFYLFYLLRLDSQTQDILHQLNKLLR
ncbi:hypothetical protein MMT79_22360, partial [Escherichia coli]|nr:hypothetical protein [Escherichia coli]